MKQSIQVLMLEDIPADADIISNALRQGELDVKVTRVETREAFERALKEQPPDLIISDHGLPAFDSLRALAIARAKLPNVPFIAVTGGIDDNMSRELLHRGATGHASKDQLPSLVSQVKQALDLAIAQGEQQRLKQEVAETEERFHLLQEGTRDFAIFLLDPEGRVTWWNAGGQTIYGYEPGQVLGQDFGYLFSSEEGERPRQLLAETQAKGRIQKEAWSKRRDGSRFRSRLTLTASRQPTGELRGYATAAQDLTESRQAAKALRQSEARQHAMLQLVQDAFISIDREGILTDWNGAAEKIFYYTHEQAVGREFVDLIIPPEMREELRQHLQAYLKAGGAERLLGRWYTMRRADGTEVPVEFALTPTNSEGAPGFTGYIRDLSRIREAEDALHESEKRYRMMVDNVTDYAIYMLDAQGNVASWNEGAKRIEGYEAEEIIGTHFSVFFTREDNRNGLPRQELEKAKLEGRSETEAWSIRKDGSRFRSHWILTPVREGAQLAGFARVAHDITQKYQAEQALRESEEQLRMVLQSARDYAIFTMDLEGRITSWNSGAEKIFGYSTEEAMGLEFAKLFLQKWVAEGHPDTELRVALQNDHVGNECWHRRKDGGRFWGSGQTMPLLDANGKARGFLKIVQDETSRRLMEMEIQAHVRQQSALARFSERALIVNDPQVLAQHAVSLIAETLGLELCAWFEFQQCAFHLRAAVGWEEELTRGLTLSTGTESQAGYTLMVNAPVIVDDLSAESRFHVPPAVRERGAVCSLSVVVPGEPQPYGVLTAHGMRPRSFSEPDVHFMESVGNVLSHTIRRKRAEEALAETEKRFRLAVEAVQDYAVYMLDAEGRVASWNVGAERIEGYQPQEILGRPLHTFFTPEDIERGLPDQELERARTTGRSRTEGWAVRKDGSRFRSDWVLTGLRDEAGNLTGFIKVARDVSELRETQEQLRQSEERFRLAVEAVQDYAIYMLDAEGRVATYNLGATRLEGYQPEEIIGRPLHTFFPPEDRARGVPDRELERARTEGKSQTEGWNVRKDGSRFMSNWLLTAVRDSQGNLTGYSKVARDVTEIKKAEKQLQHWNEELARRVAERTRQLEASNKELEAFSYSVSHDLRAPLRHINAFIVLLEEALGADIPPLAREHLRVVSKSALQMARLVDDLLTFSRMARQEMRRVPVRLAVLVHEAQLHLQTDMQGRDIEWVIGNCPQVMGDPASLRQVLINLLSNALKYTKTRAHARIEVGCDETATETICHVRDNGVGFEMEYAQKLFGVFQRLHSPRQFEGTGIGLAIVRRIVQRHGGRTWAEAEVDRGATFYFSLPKHVSSAHRET